MIPYLCDLYLHIYLHFWLRNKRKNVDIKNMYQLHYKNKWISKLKILYIGTIWFLNHWYFLTTFDLSLHLAIWERKKLNRFWKLCIDIIMNKWIMKYKYLFKNMIPSLLIPFKLSLNFPNILYFIFGPVRRKQIVHRYQK